MMGRGISSETTENDDIENNEELGIIPRAIGEIFNSLNNDKLQGRMATIRVSMLEIYNDECKDLLHTEIPSRDIMLREDKHGRIFFTGAREEVVTSTSAALQYLDMGNLNRTTAETLMNQSSSRSHVSEELFVYQLIDFITSSLQAIFTVSLEMLEYSVSQLCCILDIIKYNVDF